MKKKIISLAAIAIVAVAAVVGISKNANHLELSDLTLANVEALAYEENGGGKYCQWDDSNKVCNRTASGPVCLGTNSDCRW